MSTGFLVKYVSICMMFMFVSFWLALLALVYEPPWANIAIPMAMFFAAIPVMFIVFLLVYSVREGKKKKK